MTVEKSLPWLLAATAFALAYFSPVEYVDSDPAIALLVSQSLLDHHTPRLDAYRDDPACAYDLESDYRIRRRDGSYFYYSPGVPLLSLPAVWAANLAGYHMLDQGDELALQNLLSALCCALLAVLLYRICRAFLDPPASLAIGAITLFGSSLTSTLATGLWNAGYEILFLALGLLHLVHRDAGRRPNRIYLALLAGLAFLCRPTAAFAVLAGVVALAPAGAHRKRSFWWLAAALLALTILLIVLDLAGWIPRYYSPLKLTPRTPLLAGLHGVLASPSRGLLVFSPFLILVAAGAVRFLGTLAGNRLFRLAALWTGLQLLAVATKGAWWGGHSYGPRLLTEVMLPAVLVSCLVWRELERRGRRRARALAAAAYLSTGLGAIFIHSYQGLFNHATVRWNYTPDIDRFPRVRFDWRHPQFLASETSLEERILDHRRRQLETYLPGETIAHDGAGAIFRHWYPPEAGWRWSRGRSAEIILRLGELAGELAGELYVLQLRAGSLGRQEITLEVNGTAVGHIVLDGHAGRERALAFERGLLRPGAENSFRFGVPGAASTAGDARLLGLALYSFKLYPLPPDFGGVGFGDPPFFPLGFSDAESDWRWTDGRRAVIAYPVAGAAGRVTLELSARALIDQRVGIRINGAELGELSYDGGFAIPVARQLTFDSAVLRPWRMNAIELGLPGAQGTAEDPRLLGLAVERLELRPAPAE